MINKAILIGFDIDRCECEETLLYNNVSTNNR